MESPSSKLSLTAGILAAIGASVCCVGPLVLLGLGVYVARSHRRALIAAGLGLAASMVVLGLGLTIFRGVYLNSVPPRVLPADAAAVLYDTLIRFIRDGLRIVLVVGLIVAVAAFFSGPSVTAVRTRGAFKSGFDWLRRSGERAENDHDQGDACPSKPQVAPFRGSAACAAAPPRARSPAPSPKAAWPA